jgi:hypothetical protein
LKKTDAIPVVFVALAAVAIGSGFMSHRGGPKKYSPEYARREEARRAKVLPALEALRKGDKSREAEVRGVIASLPPYDSWRNAAWPPADLRKRKESPVGVQAPQLASTVLVAGFEGLPQMGNPYAKGPS